MTPSALVRPVFRRSGRLDVGLALGLLTVFSVVRVAVVLSANATGSYQLAGAVFALMIVLPFVLLTRDGRRDIGLVRPRRWWALPLAVAAGAAACLALVGIVTLLWGQSLENPFAYIARSYSALPTPMPPGDLLVYFAIFAAIGVTFSPIGEELLYRGVVHRGLASGWGSRRASVADAAAFAIVHLAHFGVVIVAGVWSLLPLPALLWVVAMFLVSLLFTAFRNLAGSLAGAVLAHAGFNLAMTAAIFAWFLG